MRVFPICFKQDQSVDEMQTKARNPTNERIAPLTNVSISEINPGNARTNVTAGSSSNTIHEYILKHVSLCLLAPGTKWLETNIQRIPRRKFSSSILFPSSSDFIGTKVRKHEEIPSGLTQASLATKTFEPSLAPVPSSLNPMG
uniref:Uncharacterized protein n=1 Tax=Vespula pensylvanica TaxID=30213 RepID=A0A834UAC3_VESPE|nr:hypothetical protein H0235_008031 [Vespula pensylvanica]